MASSEENTAAEEAKASVPEHLTSEHFRLRIDAFRSPVVVRQRARRFGGLDVEVEARGEGVQVLQVSGPGVPSSCHTGTRGSPNAVCAGSRGDPLDGAGAGDPANRGLAVPHQGRR
jgi:hypothetical protein